MYYFRADGSAKTGAGHLMRCLTVALELQKLTEHPEQVCFLCADEASAELLRSNHMPVKVLGTDPEVLEGELPVLERLAGDTKQLPGDGCLSAGTAQVWQGLFAGRYAAACLSCGWGDQL